MTLIIPSRIRVRRNDRLREHLQERGERQFRNIVALTLALSRAVERVGRERRLSMLEMLSALLGQVVAFVQSQAPSEEWDHIGAVLAEELRARLTVTGDTGEDDHARRMV